VWNDSNQPDTNRLKAIQDIANKGYLFSQPDSAFYFAQMQYNMALAKGHKSFMTQALNIQGVSLAIRGDYPQALENFAKVMEINEEMGNKQGIADALNNMANIYTNQGNYNRALDYYGRSVDIQDEIGEIKVLANCLNNMGIIYNTQGNLSMAMEHFLRSLKLSEKIGYKQGMGNALTNIGSIYKEQGKYSQAMEYQTRSLKIYEEIGDKSGMAFSLDGLGIIYQGQGDYQQAMNHYNRSLVLREEIGGKENMAVSLSNIASIYFEQRDYKNATFFSNKALSIAQEVGAVLQILVASNTLYESYKNQDQNAKAIEMYELYIKMNDSIINEENTKQMLQLQTKMEYDNKLREQKLILEKKQAVEEEKVKRYLYIGILVFIITLLAIGGVFWGLRQRLVSEKLGAELSFLKSQINPHFLFNTLNNIYALVLKKSSDAPNAVLMLSDIMRYMLHDSNHTRVLLEKEIDYLSNFIKLQQLRLGKGVNVDITVNGAPNGLEIAPMLLIPFVENAFKHGELQQKDAYIKIQLDIGSGAIDFLVENLLRKKKEKTTSGIGLDNLQKRLALIYPGQYEMERKEHGNTYICKLKLQLA